MQKNYQVNQLSLTLSSIISAVYFRWMFALLSGICIMFMFYSTVMDKTGVFSTDAGFQSSSNNKNPVSLNAGTGIQRTQTLSTIVEDALAFKAMLTTDQQSTLELTYTTSLARKWSNLPCGTTCRNGLQLGTNLTSTQYAAAMQVIKDALSSSLNNGYDEFHQMNLAEAYLHANGGGSGYDSTLRWICFLNTPTATGPWMLQFGGHHYAANIAFNNGKVIGATPFFMGLEPKAFTYNSVSYDPLGDERIAFASMLSSLSTSDLSTALISSTFSDCVMIPGETMGGASSFPSVNIGKACSSLTTDQQNLVLAAIQLYVGDMDSATATTMMALYTSEINETYISYVGGGTSGSASSFLNYPSDYARVSGPHVWIEFSCQSGVVIQGQTHYHTVWRDRTHDYGVDLTGEAIDGSVDLTGISEVSTNKMLKVYPNPSSSEVNMTLPETVSNAKISVTDFNGKTVYSTGSFYGEKINLNIQSFASGNYFLFVRDDTHFYSGKFIKQ